MALPFLSYATDAQRLTDQSKHIAYGLVRPSAAALVVDKVRAHLPTAESNRHNALRRDDTWWIRHQDAMEVRFGHGPNRNPGDTISTSWTATDSTILDLKREQSDQLGALLERSDALSIRSVGAFHDRAGETS
jgi:hypothetical protein